MGKLLARGRDRSHLCVPPIFSLLLYSFLQHLQGTNTMDSKFLSHCRFFVAVALLVCSERLPDTEEPQAKAGVLKAAITKPTGLAKFNSQKKVANSMSELKSKANVDEFADHGESFAVLHRASLVKNKKATHKRGVDAAKK